MKTKRLYQLMGAMLLAGMCLAPSFLYKSEAYSGGDGTSSNPYLISTPEDLNELRKTTNNGNNPNTGTKKYYKMTNDIDLVDFDTDSNPNNGNWRPIGVYGTNSTGPWFYGDFDGDGHVVKNLSITSTESSVGLFGYVNKGSIHDVGVVNAQINGGDYVGAVVGRMNSSSVSNVYASGTVSGRSYVGGAVGYSHGTNGKLSNMYSFAAVNGSSEVGGVIGLSEAVTGATASNCYWDKEASGVSSSRRGTGLTTAQMTGGEAKKNLVGFDFNGKWVVSDRYPRLINEEPESATLPDNASNTTINGDISATVISFTVPTELSFSINPNAEAGDRFAAPEFTVLNDSNSPLTLSVGTFEETTDLFTDVHGDRYQDSEWDKLGVKDSKKLALALNLESGENWLVQTQLDGLYAAAVQESIRGIAVGTIRPNSDVAFNFSAKHGLAFKEALNPEYSITFIFDLFNE